MTARLRFFFTVSLAVLTMAGSLLAHHYGGTVYDNGKRITLKGKITKIEWMNPHVYYYFQVTEPNGSLTTWEAENGPPNALYRRGWRKDDLKPGDMITLENAALARNGSKKVSGGSLILPTGQKVFSGTAGDGLDGVR